jgi:hypothetical protein
MKEYLRLVEGEINIKGIVGSDDIDGFMELNDTIINLKGICDMATQIVLRMKTRRIYKIVGEAELINIPAHVLVMIKDTIVDDEKVVRDIISIRYYGVLKCEYFSNDKYLKISANRCGLRDEISKDINIMSVYSKQEEYDEYALQYFNDLMPIHI